jgi:hypothetical protein
MNFTGIVIKANTAPRGHASFFPRSTLKKIVEHKQFINKPLFASSTLLNHTNHSRKSHIGYISECWLDKRGNLHIFGDLIKEPNNTTGEPLGLSMDSIIYNLTPVDFAVAAWAQKKLRVDSLYVQGATVLFKQCAASSESTFYVLKSERRRR